MSFQRMGRKKEEEEIPRSSRLRDREAAAAVAVAEIAYLLERKYQRNEAKEG